MCQAFLNQGWSVLIHCHQPTGMTDLLLGSPVTHFEKSPMTGSSSATGRTFPFRLLYLFLRQQDIFRAALPCPEHASEGDNWDGFPSASNIRFGRKNAGLGAKRPGFYFCL